MHTQTLLQALPKVDTLLSHPRFASYNAQVLKPIIQRQVERARQALRQDLYGSSLAATHTELAACVMRVVREAGAESHGAQINEGQTNEVREELGDSHARGEAEDSKDLGDLREALGELEDLDALREVLSHALIESIAREYEDLTTSSLVPLVNATGVVVQTNLGRSVFAPKLLERIAPLLTRYCSLEYDTLERRRSSRYAHANTLLKALFCQEYEFLLVNNNAAAVLLILNTFAKDREVIISRGELVEIGGEFRIPEVMISAGALLTEVGATNKTHLRDYERALSERTAMLMKAHKSNFAQIGFCSEVEMCELSALARKYGLIDYYDLGSGCVLDLPCESVDRRASVRTEPSLREIFAAPPSLLSFSGDKLFGASQVGIIAGEPHLIATLKQNHLLRALRVDKLCISALQATLEAYLRDELDSIPTLAMLSLTPEALQKRAKKLCQMIESRAPRGISAQIVEVDSLAGGGSLPDRVFRSVAVGLRSTRLKASALESRLRVEHAIIARVSREWVLLDTRTLLEGDMERICEALGAITESSAKKSEK